MSKQAVHIEVMPLRVPLKLTFRHAGASRNEGKSIWIRAARNGVEGFGEGCPRDYVAGDGLGSSIRWIQETFPNGEARFDTFDDVQDWTEKNSTIIDSYPSAWCAMEMALLDLFSREKDCTVETLLGVAGRLRQGSYTAILGDDKEWEFTSFVVRYIVLGFTDFKIKLHGDLKKDLAKLAILEELCQQLGITDFRIRLDANNLWSGRPEEAINHLTALHATTENLFAVEEPVAPRAVEDISRVSLALGLPVILDESLCTLGDLSLFANLPGKFIANIKLSKTGGLIRALGLIEALKKKGWAIIMGCHVGETSVLTRAALTSAHAAGTALIAQEGAFGDYLVEREPVSPSLQFGRHGLLDLNRPYYFNTVEGLQVIPAENWRVGFGMQGRMPVSPDDGRPETLVLEMADQYKIHSRVWGEAGGEDVLLVLHGGMSHSGWQAPLANALRSLSHNISIVAPDRRGCGLNEKRGDLGSVNLVIEDIVNYVEFLKKSFKRVYLAGWSQGAQYASIAAVKLGDVLSGLVLLTPGFFWNERFRSVISVAER
ncbi:MAG TPA: alpha/beta fold hydrolase, partial [Desulfobacteraceae bacterium]|nr:alpha/beta fold hydrolase [Desulfobacteraceae bacterium]